MNADNKTALWAIDVLRRYAPHPLSPTDEEIEADEQMLAGRSFDRYCEEEMGSHGDRR